MGIPVMSRFQNPFVYGCFEKVGNFSNFMTANRDRFPQFVKWEQGYCALTYSEADKERVIQYIINQKEHHRKLSARDELIALLKECGVEYDERYI